MTSMLMQVVPEPLTKRPSRARRLLTAKHLDGRTRGAKRARQIAAELIAAFGPAVTPVQKQAAERAAIFCALSEDLAARRLRGEAVSLDELMRLEGVARRAVARLGLPEREPENGDVLPSSLVVGGAK
jgi:hypothetical protein